MCTTTKLVPPADGSAALAPAPTMRGLQAVPFTLWINGEDYCAFLSGAQVEQSA